MCDADTYATGLLLTQISVGLLTSVLINTAAKSIHQPMPTAQAVPVSKPEEYEKEEGVEESAAEPAVPPVERVGKKLRRRNFKQTKHKDSVTIKINDNLAKNMTFDF